ncbi:hypothetical protein AB6F62_13355 [Providencia huaxiensis]
MSAPDIYPTILGLLGLEQWIPAQLKEVNLAERVVTGEGSR